MITVFNASFYGGERKMKDPVKQPQFDGVEYIMFTNRSDLPTNLGWKYIQYDTDNLRLSAREIKTMVHNFLPDSEYWMWVDSHMKIQTDPTKIVNHYMKVHDICAMPHPERHNWYEESQLIIQSNRDTVENVMKAIRKYYSEGFAPVSLYETGVLIRRNTKRVIEFNQTWWDEITTASTRDQISFPYSAWKHGIAINTFAGTNSVNALRYHNKKYLTQWEDVVRDWN